MLIGPTITLAELQQHMEDKLNGNKMELNESAKKVAKLRNEFQVTPKMSNDEKTNEEIVNPAYLEILEGIEKLQDSMEELNDQNEFIAIRLEELEGIEDSSLGKIDKSKNKITLTLKDCIALGIELNKDEVE